MGFLGWLFHKKKKEDPNKEIEKAMEEATITMNGLNKMGKVLARPNENEKLLNKEKTRIVYHGVSETSRGSGGSFLSLTNIINTGSLFPSEFSVIDEFFSAIFTKVGKEEGIDSAKTIDIDNYLKWLPKNDLLFSNPAVNRYVTDEKFKASLHRFKGKELKNFNLSNYAHERRHVNWVSEDREDIQESYGQDFYFEFKVPSDKIVYEEKNKFGSGVVAEPISLENATKLIVGEKYCGKIPQIQGMLKEKGYTKIKVEKSQ